MLLTAPRPKGAKTTAIFGETFEHEVYPSDTMRTNQTHATGTCWTKADDDSVTTYGNIKYVF